MTRILLIRGFSPGPTNALYNERNTVLNPEIPMPNNLRFLTTGNVYLYAVFLLVTVGVYAASGLIMKRHYFMAALMIILFVQAGAAIHVAAIKSFSPDIIIAYSWGGGVLCRMLEKGVWDGPCIFIAAAQDMMYSAANMEVPKLSKIDTHRRRGVIVHGTLDLVVSIRDSQRLHSSISAGEEKNWKFITANDDHMLYEIGSGESFQSWIDFCLKRSPL